MYREWAPAAQYVSWSFRSSALLVGSSVSFLSQQGSLYSGKHRLLGTSMGGMGPTTKWTRMNLVCGV